MKNKPILLVQEPYLYKEKPLIRIPNYILHFGGKNSRAALAVPKNLKTFFVKDISDRDTTAVLFEEDSSCDNKPILLVSAYLDILDRRVISSGLANIGEFSLKNKIPVVLGIDSNAHSSLWGCGDNNHRGDILEEWILEQKLRVVNVGTTPTFVTIRASSIIDVTLVSDDMAAKITNWRVNKEYQFSDHRRLEFELDCNPCRKILTRNFKKGNWKLFRTILKRNPDWSPPIRWSKSILDAEAVKLTTEIQKALDVACPLRQVDLNVTKKNWWNDDLQALKHKAKRLYRKLHNNKSQSNYDFFHVARKQYYDAINVAKIQARQDFCNSIQDVKSLSKTSKALNQGSFNTIGLLKKTDGTFTLNSKEILNVLMDTHFPGSTPFKEGKESKSEEEEFLGNNFIENAAFLSYITVEKVRIALKSFNGFKAAGPDGLKPIALQNLPDSFLERMTTLFKVSTALKYNPKEWSKSRVIFIPKLNKEDYDNPKSFRPISLTQFIFKTEERVQKWEVEDKYLSKKPMHEYQFAFRKGKSTEGALSQVVDKIESGLYRSQFTLGVFLDISGAFDNISIDSIIKGFKRKEISENITRWFESSLRNRIANATLGDDSISVKRSLTRGTAQGGVLSTIAWNIAIDDILEELNKPPFLVVGFADDLAVLISGIDPNTLVSLIQPVINKITSIGKGHGLEFNASKTQVVMFTNKRTKDLSFDKVKINRIPIEYSNGASYLGVHLDSKLSFNKHIEDKIKKCKKHLFALKSLIGREWGPSPWLMKWAFTGIVRPKLTYGCHIWQNKITETLRGKLLRLNRLAMLNIAKVHKSTPTKGLEIIYNIPPLDLFIERISMHSYLRIKSQIKRTWDGIGSRNKGHLNIGETECGKLGLSNLPNDNILPIRVWNRNFEILDFSNDCYKESKKVIYCYTDGSKIEGSKTGCGFTIHQRGKTTSNGYEGLGTTTTVFQAEIVAIIRGSEAMMSNEKQRIVFRIDSQAAILALNANIMSSSLVLECFKNLNALGAKNRIQLQWIKSHVGHLGNEEADMLAKKGAEQDLAGPEPFLPASSAIIKKLTNSDLLSKWNSQWKSVKSCRQTKLWMPECSNKVAKYFKKLPRQDLGKLVQFITGHCNLMKHKSLQDKQIKSACRLCKEKGKEETPWHLVTECPSLMTRRTNVFDGHILFKVEWSTGQLLRFCKESKIWSMLDHQL